MALSWSLLLAIQQETFLQLSVSQSVSILQEASYPSTKIIIQTIDFQFLDQYLRINNREFQKNQ